MPPSPLVPRTNVGKVCRALRYCARRPASAAAALAGALAQAVMGVFRDGVAADSRVPERSVDDVVGPEPEVRLARFRGRDGNVTLGELCVIAALVRRRRPQVLLEIGTFDGNTALQMALNAPEDATVFTLDLPPGAAAAGALDPHDDPYVRDTRKVERRYEGAAAEAKVVQWLGDSATFDFTGALGGRAVDLAFIDGSHSYDYVRNDTAKVLACLAADGLVLWHDFKPAWPGVVQWLAELARREPVFRIAGTSLVCLDRAAAKGTARAPAVPAAAARTLTAPAPAPTAARR